MISSNIFKKRISGLIVVIFLMLPVSSLAFTLGPGAFIPGLPVGGFILVTVPCTCSENLLIVFGPMHPSPPLPKVGALVYQPGYTTLYGNFAIGVPTTWHLGSYIPIVGNGVCWQYVGTACTVMPNYGLINKVGTGLP